MSSSSWTENGWSVHAEWIASGKAAWLRAWLSTDDGVEAVDLSSAATSYVVREASRGNSQQPSRDYARIIHSMYS